MAQFADSQIYATAKAPYIKYLENIKDQWTEAESLDRELKQLTSWVKRYHEPVPLGRNARVGEFVNVAEILDIHDDASGRNNAIKPSAPSLGAYKDLTLPEPRAIENFLSRLRSCESSVHTRIIVLHSGRGAPGDRAADSLFFCHVLGVELDLPPTDVCNLAQLDYLGNGYVQVAEQPRQRLPMKPGFVSLGYSEATRKRSVAAYIGKRKMGTASPHVGEITLFIAPLEYRTDARPVVVRLQARKYEPCRLINASVGSLWEPPVLSAHAQYAALPARDPQHQVPPTSSTVLFKHAVRRALLSASPLRLDDLSGSWLSALIYMDAIVLTDSLDDLVSEWQDLRKKLSAEETKHSEKLKSLSQSADEVCNSLQTSVNQVAAFRKSYPAARYSDFGEAYHFLNRLLGDAKPVTREIKDEINRQQEDLNLKVSRTALEESRSAISREYLTSDPGRLFPTSLTNVSHSHRPGVYLHSDQHGLVHIWDERERDRRQRQHLGFRCNSVCANDVLGIRMVLVARALEAMGKQSAVELEDTCFSKGAQEA